MDGSRFYFDWSFYSQGTRDQTTASSDSFIAAALGFFGSDEGKNLANSPASARDKAIKLLEFIRKERTLLVLRIDRDLPWAEIAEIMDSREPALRKRFERLKEKIRKLAESEGLLR